MISSIRRGGVCALAVLALVLAGCSGIPHSSGPSVVEPIGLGQPSAGDVPAPEKGADARTIVQGFLDANGSQDPARDGAYQYLTSQARSHWDSSTVTIVTDEHLGVFAAGKVEVTGTEVGTIDRTGVYGPPLTSNVTASYGMQLVGGEWRINTVPNGLLLTVAQFDTYRQRTIYFFDAAEQHLVPDPRWSPPLEPDALAQFLIGELARGPRDNLQADETTEFPAQSDPTHVLVTTVGSGGLTKIEIPQASQLGARSLNLLAAQIAHTLVPQVGSAIDQMEITDGGVPVPIQAAHGAVFTQDEVTGPYLTAPNPVGLFYVNSNGGVVDESGGRLPGKIGSGAYRLDSAALTNSSGGKGLLVVGTLDDHSQLDIGSLANGGKMIQVGVPRGPLSRPDWVPGLTEAWVGDGTKLYRVLPNGSASVITVSEPSVLANANPSVTAVRLSPEGARVALVLTTANGSAQIWVGSVVRGSGPLHVDNLTAISPPGIDIVDVAWNDELKLFAVGHDAATNAGGVYEVQVDGSLWTDDGIANLPSAPDSITVSKGLVAAVSSGGTIWKQQAAAWVSLQGPGEDAKGSAPIYST